MKIDRRIILNALYIALGMVLFGLGFADLLDAFWSGMGGALISVCIIRTIHMLRYSNDEAYRQEREIETTDERNRFIRNMAWAWAAYLFMLIAAVSTIVLKLLGQDLLSIAAGFAVCILMLLYWVCCLVLKQKY
jgi:hypothetical protein